MDRSDDSTKNRVQLIAELSKSRQRIEEMERAETEHAAIVNSLRESSRKYQALFENSTQAIYVVQDAFVKFVKKLLKKGFTKEETKDFLDNIYSVVSGDFGN